MIKNLTKKTLRLLILVLNFKTVRAINFKLKVLRNYIYNGLVSGSFRHKIESCSFEYPVIIKGGEHIIIGNNFSSRSRLRIEAWDNYLGESFSPIIKIGENVNINFDCHIGAINRIEIGNNVLIGSRVLIIDHNHGLTNKESLVLPPIYRSLVSKGPVIIEDNVWISEGVAILPNVRIGRNSIIGANSVVIKDVPSNCVVSGVPAVIIKRIDV